MWGVIGCAVFAFGCLVTLLGAIMYAKARKGEQCTLAGVIFIIGLLCIGFGGRPAFGQDHSGHRPQDMEAHRLFYNSWKMPDNRSASCCHEKDCRPAEVNYINGRLHARQEGDGGDFTLIPPAKIEQDRDSPDGRNHLCGNRYGVNGSFNVFCFIAGSGG